MHADMMKSPAPLTERDLDAQIAWKQADSGDTLSDWLAWQEPGAVMTDEQIEAAHCATEVGAAQDHSRLMREDRIVRGVMVALGALGVMALILAVWHLNEIWA